VKKGDVQIKKRSMDEWNGSFWEMKKWSNKKNWKNESFLLHERIFQKIKWFF